MFGGRGIISASADVSALFLLRLPIEDDQVLTGWGNSPTGREHEGMATLSTNTPAVPKMCWTA